MIRLSEDDEDEMKHVAVLKIHKIMFIYIYIVHMLVWIINRMQCASLNLIQHTAINNPLLISQ